MRAVGIILSAIIVLSQSVSTQAFYVEASRRAVVRSQPARDGEALLRLERGDQLNVVTGVQTNRFYNVFLPDGETGWVSSWVVRIYEGQAPEAPEVAVVPSIGRGPTTSERTWASLHFAVGKPRGYREIMREGYAVGYDPGLKLPVWIQYRLRRAEVESTAAERTRDFWEDTIIPPQGRATVNDYDAGRSIGYVRGHMAPNRDMLRSASVERESNFLTNVAPQIGTAFNGSVWLRIENAVRGWAVSRGDLTIICGPTFEARERVHSINRQPDTARQMLYNVIGHGDVAVPTGFYKIVVDMRNLDNPNVLAFLVPHFATEDESERQITNYLTSVDTIEMVTGLDFLSALPDRVQETVESVAANKVW